MRGGGGGCGGGREEGDSAGSVHSVVSIQPASHAALALSDVGTCQQLVLAPSRCLTRTRASSSHLRRSFARRQPSHCPMRTQANSSHLRHTFAHRQPWRCRVRTRADSSHLWHTCAHTHAALASPPTMTRPGACACVNKLPAVVCSLSRQCPVYTPLVATFSQRLDDAGT